MSEPDKTPDRADEPEPAQAPHTPDEPATPLLSTGSRWLRPATIGVGLLALLAGAIWRCG